MKEKVKMDSKYTDKTIKIIINGKEYAASAFFDRKDTELLSTVDFKAESISYKEIALAVLRNHINDFPTEKICKEAISDSDLNRYIEAYIASSEKLQSIYDDIECDDIPRKFILCLNEREKQLAENIKLVLESFAKALKASSAPVEKVLNDPKFQSEIDAFSHFYKAVIETKLNEMARTISASMQIMTPYLQEIQDMYQGFVSAAKYYSISSLSEEQKSALEYSFSKWGEYGWTLPPTAEIELFYDAPKSEADANIKLRPYIGVDGMKYVFENSRQMKHIRNSDLEEAIANYEDKRYKSCTMMLFALIDGRILQLQERNAKKRRSTGYGGAARVMNKIGQEELEKRQYIKNLFNINILKSINAVFMNGNDFIEQPNIINRNFVDHGMLDRNVTQEDCQKLFLLLFNWNMFIDEIRS